MFILFETVNSVYVVSASDGMLFGTTNEEAIGRGILLCVSEIRICEEVRFKNISFPEGTIWKTSMVISVSVVRRMPEDIGLHSTWLAI